MRQVNLAHPPRSLRRPGVKFDNIALVPASLLPYKTAYQAMANRLPPGDVLVVLPATGTNERGMLAKTISLWRAKGRHVTVVAAAALRREDDR